VEAVLLTVVAVTEVGATAAAMVVAVTAMALTTA